MNCEQFEKLISPYIDDELSKDETEKLEEHLRDCTKCCEQLQAITYMRDMMTISEDQKAAPPMKIKKKIYTKIYRDLLIMFAGLVIIISIVSIFGGFAQIWIFSKVPRYAGYIFIGGIILLITGLIVLLYDIFIDMFKVLTKK